MRSLWRLFKPDTLIRNMGFSFGETALSKGLNFLTILLLARTLGPHDYGKYSFIFITMAFCSAFFDFGMDNTAIRFAARDRQHRFAVFGLYLLLKLAILALLVVFFLLGGGWLFGWMRKAEMIPYIPYLIIGMLGESLFLVNDVWLMATRRFRLKAVLTVLRYAMLFGYMAALVANGWVHLEWIFWGYVIPLALSLFFIGRYCSFLGAYLRQGLGSLRQEIVTYQKWMFSYAIANNLMSRVDFFMLAFWVGYKQLGVYNAAVQLSAVVSFLPLVMGKVLLPTLSESSRKDIISITRRMVRVTVVICGAGVLLMPTAVFLIPLLLGGEYTDAVPVLQVLVLAYMTVLIAMPYEQALYAMGKPQIMSSARYVHLAGTILLHLLTIPHFGIMAAAINTLLGRIVYLAFIRKIYQQIAGFPEPELPATDGGTQGFASKPIVEEQPG